MNVFKRAGEDRWVARAKNGTHEGSGPTPELALASLAMELEADPRVRAALDGEGDG